MLSRGGVGGAGGVEALAPERATGVVSFGGGDGGGGGGGGDGGDRSVGAVIDCDARGATGSE